MILAPELPLSLSCLYLAVFLSASEFIRLLRAVATAVLFLSGLASISVNAITHEPLQLA